MRAPYLASRLAISKGSFHQTATCGAASHFCITGKSARPIGLNEIRRLVPAEGPTRPSSTTRPCRFKSSLVAQRLLMCSLRASDAPLVRSSIRVPTQSVVHRLEPRRDNACAAVHPNHCARPTCELGFHGEGRQEICGQRRMGIMPISPTCAWCRPVLSAKTSCYQPCFRRNARMVAHSLP
jgi:hypothetical protein